MIKRKGRLQPGKLFLVDLEQGRIVEDAEVKREVSTAKPYKQWLEEGIVDPSGEGPWIAAADPGPSEKDNVHRPIR